VIELRELSAFVAVAEEGGMSAAARRLHITQPALSQTINALERNLGVKLFDRSSSGVRPTDAGLILLGEARAVLARYHQALRAMARFSTDTGADIRLGIPLELAPDILPRALAKFSSAYPDTRVVPRHLSTADQFAALRSGELDVGLVRERPTGSEFDSMLVAEENLGILLASRIATELLGPEGIRLDALAGLEWLSFPRSGSPQWHDEVTTVLARHGITIGPPPPGDHHLIAAVKVTAVSSGRAFALAPERGLDPLPENVTWAALVGHPVVRRTWVVWPADSRRRDIGHLVASFDQPDPT
jgi:DNA-binding transcriptional LysR family regulator